MFVCKFARDRFVPPPRSSPDPPSSCNEHESAVRNFPSRRVVHEGQSGRFPLPCPLPPPYSTRLSLALRAIHPWQKTRYPKRRVLIFSRLPRLDLAGDSTPANTVSTFPNSRVVGGRNVGIGKGNVRPPCIRRHPVHTQRPHSRFLPVSSFPGGMKASQLRKRTPTLVTVLRMFERARADAGKRSKTEQVSLACVREVLIN